MSNSAAFSEKSLSDRSLLVVGSVAIDRIETPSESRENQIGGAASYFVAGARHLCEQLRMVAVVGNDFPTSAIEMWDKQGIDLQGLERANGKTFAWHGRYLDNWVDRETISTELNVFEHFKPRIPDSYKNSTDVFLGNIMPELQLQVLDQVNRPRFSAFDTMNFFLTGDYLAGVKKVLERTHLAFLNDEESRMLSGEHNFSRAAKAILATGGSSVIIKRGDAGAMLFDSVGPFWVPCYPTARVIDPTGAGDVFAAGVMGYLNTVDEVTPQTLRTAMLVGSATASFLVEDFSTERFRQISRADIALRCSALQDMIRVTAPQL